MDVGVGVELAGLELMGELAAIDNGRQLVDFIDTGAVSVRFARGRFRPYAALQLPLDDDSRDQDNATVIIGLDVLLR